MLYLKLDKKSNKFIIKGSSYTGKVETSNVVGNWWYHKLLQAESQISPVSGSIKEQVIIILLQKNRLNFMEKILNTEHFKLTSSKYGSS